MTLEAIASVTDNAKYIIPDECECPYFTALPTQEKIIEREFRQAAKEKRYGVIGFFRSMCGICIFNNKTQK